MRGLFREKLNNTKVLLLTIFIMLEVIYLISMLIVYADSEDSSTGNVDSGAVYYKITINYLFEDGTSVHTPYEALYVSGSAIDYIVTQSNYLWI